MKTSLKFSLLCRYLPQKVSFASLVTLQKYYSGEIALKDVWATAVKKVFTRDMVYFYRAKGVEMEPFISPRDTLVIRRLPYLNNWLEKWHQEINVGDLVVLRDPLDSNNHLVRWLAAVEGFEMASTNEDDEPFVIEHGQGWVLSNNSNLTPKESKDSRTYGPISMSDILGRVIFRSRGHDDTAIILNSPKSMRYDNPVAYYELDLLEMQRFADNEE